MLVRSLWGFLLLGIWTSQFLFAQPHPIDPSSALLRPESESHVEFIENKGQWPERVRYHLRLRGGSISFENQALNYTFWQIPAGVMRHAHDEITDPADTVTRGHRVRVTFEGANPAPQMSPTGRYAHHHNYFVGNNPDFWRGDVPLFAAIQYDEIYPGVDLSFYEHSTHLKYDFELAAGADPRQIRLRYEGADALYLRNDSLIVETSLRMWAESPPRAWQTDAAGNRIPIRCNYNLADQQLTFSFPDGYDPTLPMTIDPTLVFSTYTGSRGDNWGFTATYDSAGNFYAGGIIYAILPTMDTSFVVTAGAFQTSYAGGGTDITISKFDSSGALLQYSTFLGGSLVDLPHSMIVNDSGQLYLLGRTESTDFPVRNGYDLTQNGQFDIFVARFDSTGSQLLNATFYGGSADDGANGTFQGASQGLQANYGDDVRGEVMLDATGSVYLASSTQSTNLPTPNGYQTNNAGGQDGILAKFSEDLQTLVWATYLGGSGEDAAYGLRVNAGGEVFAAGGTSSANFPTTTGVVQDSFAGTIDGWIARISATGTRLQAATYWGTRRYDQCYFLERDAAGDIYVTGQSLGSFPLVNAGYQVANARQFVTKLNPNLDQVLVSANFGESGAQDVDISPTAFLVDVCGNIYVAGWGGTVNGLSGGTTGLPTTPGALDRVTDNSDFYVIVFEPDVAGLLYATFFGAGNLNEHVDGGTSRFDPRGVIYQAVCAGCGGSSAFPTTPGAWSQSNNSANCNLAAFKIALNLNAVEANFAALDPFGQPLQVAGCVPFRIDFDNFTQGTSSTRYFWDFGNGDNSTAFEPTYLYTQPGTYTVTLIVEDSTLCVPRDTAFATVTVLPSDFANAGLDTIICPGGAAILRADSVNRGQYLWIDPGRDSTAAASIMSGIGGQHVLIVTDRNGCRDSDTVEVQIDNSLFIDLPPDTVLCEGGSLTLPATSNGQQFQWSPSFFLDDPTKLQPVASPTEPTTYELSATSARGCTRSDTFRINLFQTSASGGTVICPGDTVRLVAQNGTQFRWSPAVAISDPNAAAPFVFPDSTTTYRLEATDLQGCISRDTVRVGVLPRPFLSVGNDVEICRGDTAQLVAQGTGNLAWRPNNALSDDQSFTPQAFPTTSQNYIAILTDAAGCTARDTLGVSVIDPPFVTIQGGSDPICDGQSVVLQARGAASYRWNGLPGLSAYNISNPTARPRQTTTYEVVGIDTAGCEGSARRTVIVSVPPRTEIVSLTPPCSVEPVVLEARGGNRVVWSTGELSRRITVPADVSARYSAIAYEGECEGSQASFLVDGSRIPPEARIVLDTTRGYAPFTVQLAAEATGITRWEWNFGDESSREIVPRPQHTFARPGIYTVRLVVTNGIDCRDTAFAQVQVEQSRYFVPSAFSPNGDTQNETFRMGFAGLRGAYIAIFSRWGVKVFESRDANFAWDGTYQGQPLPEGVYTYRLIGETLGGQRIDQVGTITLLR